MKATFNKPGADILEVSLTPDELDAEVWPRTIWIRHAYVSRISQTRLALIAYLLAREHIGNTLEFDGVACPAFLAAAAVNDFPAQELFLYPISNVAERITPDFKLDSIIVGDSPLATTGRNAQLERTELGYVVKSAEGQFADISIGTNIDLFATQSKDFSCIAEVVVFLSLFDGLSVGSLVLPAPGIRKDSAIALKHLVSEVGARLHFLEPSISMVSAP